MLFESQQFDTRFEEPAGWSDHVFRYCDFTNISTEGGDVDSVFVGCSIEDCEWYWGLFVLAVFVQVKFKKCTFRGTGFSGSKFIECDFIDCEFIKDNLDTDCYFNDNAWYGCTQNGCSGLEHEFQSKR
jgi:uncharacterized protein YjbI with pentapeptide repeats